MMEGEIAEFSELPVAPSKAPPHTAAPRPGEAQQQGWEGTATQPVQPPWQRAPSPPVAEAAAAAHAMPAEAAAAPAPPVKPQALPPPPGLQATVGDVCAWVADMHAAGGLSCDYSAAFRECGVNGRDLHQLTLDDLRDELNVGFGDRRKLLAALSATTATPGSAGQPRSPADAAGQPPLVTPRPEPRGSPPLPPSSGLSVCDFQTPEHSAREPSPPIRRQSPPRSVDVLDLGDMTMAATQVSEAHQDPDGVAHSAQQQERYRSTHQAVQCPNCGETQTPDDWTLGERVPADWARLIASTRMTCNHCGCCCYGWKSEPGDTVKRPKWRRSDEATQCQRCEKDFEKSPTAAEPQPEQPPAPAAAAAAAEEGWSQWMWQKAYAGVTSTAAAVAGAVRAYSSGKHHCRQCGWVVCIRCSTNNMPVEGYGERPVRVCDHCYREYLSSTVRVEVRHSTKREDVTLALLFEKTIYRELTKVQVTRTTQTPLQCPNCTNVQMPPAGAWNLTCDACKHTAALTKAALGQPQWLPVAARDTFSVQLFPTEPGKARESIADARPESAAAMDVIMQRILRKGAQPVYAAKPDGSPGEVHAGGDPVLSALWRCTSCHHEQQRCYGMRGIPCNHCSIQASVTPTGWGNDRKCQHHASLQKRSNCQCLFCGRWCCAQCFRQPSGDLVGHGRDAGICLSCDEWLKSAMTIVIRHSPDAVYKALAVVLRRYLMAECRGSPHVVRLEEVNMQRCPGCGEMQSQKDTSSGVTQTVCRHCSGSWWNPFVGDAGSSGGWKVTTEIAATALGGNLAGRLAGMGTKVVEGQMQKSWQNVPQYVAVFQRHSSHGPHGHGEGETALLSLPDLLFEDRHHKLAVLRERLAGKHTPHCTGYCGGKCKPEPVPMNPLSTPYPAPPIVAGAAAGVAPGRPHTLPPCPAGLLVRHPAVDRSPSTFTCASSVPEPEVRSSCHTRMSAPMKVEWDEPEAAGRKSSRVVIAKDDRGIYWQFGGSSRKYFAPQERVQYCTDSQGKFINLFKAGQSVDIPTEKVKELRQFLEAHKISHGLPL
eukprot:TRINITY_DN966_c0_g1_i1.p1 TRINITY_DN966_c0_g1~~TRINITY_DN966_c0_g1_i1.p1  ORF type:complete len:1079 (+),score=202.80 TRINITY_DN966_c0_g1_i1:98-3238(+)